MSISSIMHAMAANSSQATASKSSTDAAGRPLNLDEFEMQQALAEPMDWHAQFTHDWLNYIGAHVRSIWQTFTVAQRLAMAADAGDMAEHEDWD